MLMVEMQRDRVISGLGDIISIIPAIGIDCAGLLIVISSA